MHLLTDQLENIFGEIKAKIVQESEQLRVCHLVDSKGISRVYTLIFYAKCNTDFDAYLNAVEEIKNGALAGKTFKKYKAKILKRDILKSKILLSKNLKKSFQCNQDNVMSYLYNMSVVWGNRLPIEYGMVFEIYSPKFKGK